VRVRVWVWVVLPTPSWIDTVTLLPKKRFSCDASRALIASSCLPHTIHDIITTAINTRHTTYNSTQCRVPRKQSTIDTYLQLQLGSDITPVSNGSRHCTPGHILPAQFPRDNFPPFYTMEDIPLGHHYHPPIYNIKRSTVNVYRTDKFVLLST